MDFFMEYIQPLTGWLHNHPEWALLLAFFISFAESLAVIGSIVPGSVMMTMVGILAGSGVMRIDLTLVAATLGAIAGDWGSYFLGYVLSDRLLLLWPFKTHPHWLEYGRKYFDRHGGKSIFFGRFIGPLRSIIPVIAGMMRMHRTEFLVANSISAIAWSIVYVGPGILIGAASAQLSAESATRLFLLVIGALIVVWIASLGVQWIWKRLQHLLHEHLDLFWRRIMHLRAIQALTPLDEKNHATTAALFLSAAVACLLSISLLFLVNNGAVMHRMDAPIYYFLQSLHTPYFDAFFISITLLMSPCPLLIFIFSLTLQATITRDWRSLRYWVLLALSGIFVAYFLMNWATPPFIQKIATNQPTPRFPAHELTLATACFGFLMLKMKACSQTAIIRSIRFTLSSLLFLDGIALLYLADNWFSSILVAYCFGLTLCLLYWIMYRRIDKRTPEPMMIMISFLLFIGASITTLSINFMTSKREHALYPQHYVLTHDAWWSSLPSLPRYTTNRLGRPIGLFNIQYLGALNSFVSALETSGWKKQSNSFLQTFLLKVGHQAKLHFPLKTAFYLSQKPTLTMTYGPPKKKPLFVLSLWRSNYHLMDYQQPLWLGSIQAYDPLKKSYQPSQLSLDPLLAALSEFKINKKSLPTDLFHVLPFVFPPILLIIQEPSP
jgi:membrane protein DedA with SNARE-associated domain